MHDIPQIAKECLSYNPETGAFVWLKRPREHFKNLQVFMAWNTKYPGTVAGTTRKCPIRGDYRYVKIENVSYPLHRVAFFMVTGQQPETIDHINGNPMDNRFENLRSTSRYGNSTNKKISKKNTTGVVGVTWNKNANKYQAQIFVSGKNIHLGLFESLDAAKIARIKAQEEHSFHANHGTR